MKDSREENLNASEWNVESTTAVHWASVYINLMLDSACSRCLGESFVTCKGNACLYVKEDGLVAQCLKHWDTDGKSSLTFKQSW